MIKVSIGLGFNEEMGPVHLKKTGMKGLSAKEDDLETETSFSSCLRRSLKFSLHRVGPLPPGIEPTGKRPNTCNATLSQ
jgi:hypothetical protein